MFSALCTSFLTKVGTQILHFVQSLHIILYILASSIDKMLCLIYNLVCNFMYRQVQPNLNTPKAI